jgi:glycine cleavage system transcriptional repressor
MLRADAPAKQAVLELPRDGRNCYTCKIAGSRPGSPNGPALAAWMRKAADSGSWPRFLPPTREGATWTALFADDDGINDTQMKQHLAVSAIGGDRTGMVHELTRVISECGGNISESRMASLGTEFAMLLLVSGNWHALAKLETELKRLAETSNLSIHLKRTEPRAARTDMLPYSIDVVCLDQTGIVSGLSGFFSSRGIDIAEVSTRSYPAAHTGAPMFSVQMIVNVPSRIHVAHLREEFMEFCDSLNLDAILEPVKS